MKKEERLNVLFSEIFSIDEATEKFIYLTNKKRGKTTTTKHIEKCYINNKLGSLLKRLDPIAFNIFP